MDRINWDDSLSVNVVEIDLQHQKLMEMINELMDAIQKDKDKDILGKIVSGLINYTETHFKTEEKYFKELKYPDTDVHIKEHSFFIDKISDIIEELDTGNQTLSHDVLTFMSEWLGNHIKGTDKKYASFFNEKGVF